MPHQAIDLGRVLVERADRILIDNPQAEDKLRRILTLKLATVREGEEVTRRRALCSEFSDEDWKLISALADHPNRLLVTATPEDGQTYAEVAHEALFRRWTKLQQWIDAEREFLAWKSGLESARRAWQAMPETSLLDALLMGAALTKAESWFAKRHEDLPKIDQDLIEQSIKRDRKAKTRSRRIQGLAYAGLVVIILGLVGFIKQDFLKEQYHWSTVEQPYMATEFLPHVLTAEAERALKPLGPPFRECGKDCPEMVVIPAGTFMMGQTPGDSHGYTNEVPQHPVTIAKPFAVAKYDVTFAEWDACVLAGECPKGASDAGWDRGPIFMRSARRPMCFL